MIQFEHLCETCVLRHDCPKSDRFQQVKDICTRHLDAIVEEVQARPRDTKHLEYTLGLDVVSVVMDCPYYEEEKSQLN
jgi:hypothetical protein